jgi:predicted nuclease with TOPRIM domain
MNPIALVLLAGSVALNFLTTLGGYWWGKSEAQKKIEALQKELARILAINSQREEEIRQLEKRISELEAAVREMMAARSVFQRFWHWLMGECPEVVAKFHEMEEARARQETLDQLIRADLHRVDAVIEDLRQQYPKEMADFAA